MSRGQLSLLGAEAVPPAPADLAGVLAGRGQVTQAADGARVSVVVDHPWRASVLVTECARRGVAATSVSTIEDHISVRTVYSPLLLPLHRAWSAGAVKRAPRRLLLDGAMLRLWVETGGRCEGDNTYALPVDHDEDPVHWEALGAALALVGLGAQLVGPRRGRGASYRIVGRRRLDRLIEMIGDPPKQAPSGFWPS